jgi:chaperonin GroES
MATKLQGLIAATKEVNIAKRLDDDLLLKIGQDVVSMAKDDDTSRSDWLKKSKKAMDHALQVVEEKTFPWAKASNIKYPLLTVAALQFHGRIYPEIVQGSNIVKARVTGKDEDGEKEEAAERVADHMNYQLLEEQPEWDEETDKLLLALPIEGCEFKKTYFDPTLGRNVSNWVRPIDLIVHNSTKSLETTPRITHRLYFKPREIKEKQLDDIWLDVDLDLSSDDQDKETDQEFFEQHTFLDLDDDGYKEPYIITVHVNTEKVIRIKTGYFPEDITIKKNGQTVKLESVIAKGIKIDDLATHLKGAKVIKIDRFSHFEKFSFIPSPDGSFYDIGFGQLIGPLNDGVDTLLNQMVDAGTLANLGGGWVRGGVGPKNKRSPVTFTMGEYKVLDVPASGDIRGAVLPMQFAGPSAVLFNLLGTLIQGVKDITSVQDIFTGGQQAAETATTTLARIEQGLKVFSAIFKRVYRGLGKEFKTLYRLNAIFLEPETYFRVLDDASEGVVTLSDYRNDGTDIQPVADPTIATNTQRVARAQLLMQLKGDPTLSVDEINRRFLEAIEEPNIDALIIPPEQRQAPPDPKMIELQIKMLESRAQTAKTEEEIELVRASTIQTYAKAVEAIANAESKEAGDQLAIYRTQLEGLIRQTEVRNAGMGEAAGNQAVQEVSPGLPAEVALGAEPDSTAGAIGGGGGELGAVLPGQV